MVRIAQVCHRYSPNVGGVERHVQEIAEMLAERHEVEVISADLAGGLPPSEVIKGVKVTRLRSLSPGEAYFFAPSIRSYLKKGGFDVVHAHNYHAFPALFAALACDREKFVFTPHYHGVGSTPLRNLLNRPYRKIGSRIFEVADRIICVSQYERRLVARDFGFEEKIEVIPNGINLDDIKRAEPFEVEGMLILYIGRLDRYKNVDRVVEAMEHLPEDFRFFIGGTGIYQNDLKRMAERLNLTDRVKLLGFVSEEDKYRWMKSCDLFVNLSSVEAFGMTVLEALAAGAPAVVNAAGGLGEFSERFGGVSAVRPEDISSEELAHSMRISVGRVVEGDLESYDWRRIVENIEDTYNNLL